MEHMTYFKNGRWYIRDGAVVYPVPRSNTILLAAIEKLAAYENTAMTPEEIAKFQTQRREK